MEPASEDLGRLHGLTSRFARLYQLRANEEGLSADLSVADVYALASLHRTGPSAMSDLAEDLRLSKGRVTRLVDGLEARGLVRRTRSESDRRVQVVALTPTGRRRHDRVHDRFVAHLASVLEPLSPTARRTFLAGLERLVEAVEDWRTTLPARP